jgi:small nuclear ribonucleoprotein F
MNLELVSPTAFVESLKGKSVVVKLKWGMEYKGFLSSSDEYMNLHLVGTEEWTNGKLAGNLGEVVIRCNNVLYIGENTTTETGIEEAKSMDTTA